eukprot:c5507_g1_i1.p1 GENE.c5507_g1_i1~~c5507_g1_i1.p1  ORF type:complete len:205 (+),score=53.66 c5507_g1_i1:177-791(+)
MVQEQWQEVGKKEKKSADKPKKTGVETSESQPAKSVAKEEGTHQEPVRTQAHQPSTESNAEWQVVSRKKKTKKSEDSEAATADSKPKEAPAAPSAKPAETKKSKDSKKDGKKAEKKQTPPPPQKSASTPAATPAPAPAPVPAPAASSKSKSADKPSKSTPKSAPTSTHKKQALQKSEGGPNLLPWLALVVVGVVAVLFQKYKTA